MDADTQAAEATAEVVVAVDALAAPESPAPPTDAPPSAAATAVREWFSQVAYNSPISRSTEAFNHLSDAIPALIAKIEAL